jgi:redox-sensitive bicupin YhaK (pirin superfamily)
MKSIFFPANERGSKDIGWLRSKFTFSFSDYYNPTVSAFGTLVAFNDDILEAGKGFGTHPHANMEIISVLLQGKMNHRDSMGYSTEVSEGGVQIMSAGSGLFHEEYNIGEDEVHFLQIWIQPKLQDVKPRYQNRHFPKAKRKNMLRTIVSNEEGLQHCWINQNTRISLGYYDPGSIVDYAFLPENKCVFLFCISGLVEVAGHKPGPGDAVGIWDTGNLQMVCREESEFILIETPVNQK